MSGPEAVVSGPGALVFGLGAVVSGLGGGCVWSGGCTSVSTGHACGISFPPSVYIPEGVTYGIEL